jgi:hypothetical protein
MSEQEARALALQINGEPGWHAEPYHNTWIDLWSVRAWQGEGEEAEENAYSFKHTGGWHRLHAVLAEEANREQF